MMKVIAVGQYDGEYPKKDGSSVKYSKVMLTVSINGKYPKLIPVDIEVYQATGGKLLGKDIEINYVEKYGKMKPNKIEVLN